MELPQPRALGRETIISSKISAKDYWLDLWQHRGLLSFLVWRDLVVKYKQTAIGIVWVFLKALLNIFILTMIFGRVFKLDSGGVPYSLVVLTGMLIWQLFSNVMSDTSNCLSANSGLLAKVYFPRLIFPISILILCLVDFFISFLLVIALLAWNNVMPTWHVIFFPCFVLLAAMTALSVGIIMASLSVRYRDLKQLIPFVLQIGMYVSPVAYLTSIVPGKWAFLYALNPLVGIIDGFRWTLLGGGVNPYWPGILYSFVSCVTLFVLSIMIFRSAEKGFVDTL